MHTIAPQLNALPMLYEQHRLYTDDLGKTHAGLAKLYKKLTKADRRLNEREEVKLSRAQAKKLWWSRTIAKQSIQQLEAHKDSLYSRLQQCCDLIASYDQEAYNSPATGFWTTHFPPTPFVVTPFTPFPETPWTAGPYRTPFVGQPQPQYWDLSMLQERREASPADSGFHEAESSQAAEHVTVHELMSASYCSATDPDRCSNGSEKDDVPDMPRPSMIDTNKANALHKRRYSESAIQAAAERPELSQVQRRGVSAAPGTRNERAVTAPELGTRSEQGESNKGYEAPSLSVPET